MYLLFKIKDGKNTKLSDMFASCVYDLRLAVQ